MSDLDTLKEMFDRAGIVYFVPESTTPEKPMLSVEAGYVGFVSEFSFDKDGNLKTVEAFE